MVGVAPLQQKMLIQLQATVTSQQAKLTQYEQENQQLREALSVSDQKLQIQEVH